MRPPDSQGRLCVMAYDVPVRCGDVLVHPGELVFADFNGVVVVPQAAEMDVLRLAMEKMGKDTASRQALLSGKSPRTVDEAFCVL